MSLISQLIQQKQEIKIKILTWKQEEKEWTELEGKNNDHGMEAALLAVPDGTQLTGRKKFSSSNRRFSGSPQQNERKNFIVENLEKEREKNMNTANFKTMIHAEEIN